MSFDFASPPPKPALSIDNYKHRRPSSLSPSRSSSLQKVWAEDYFVAEDYEDEGLRACGAQSLTPPPVATLPTRLLPRNVPVSEDEEACPAPQTSADQRSLTALLPFRAPRTRTNTASPQRSPGKEKEEEDFIPTLTGDKDGTIRVADKSRGKLSSWFTGSSAPVAVGIPVAKQDSSPTSPEKSPERRRPTLSTPDSMANTTSTKSSASGISRFAFFNNTPKTLNTIQLPQSTLENDELLTLDISTALSHVGAQDPFSPSSFKNLLVCAEGLLLKLQTAYKLRTLSLHELEADKEAMTDELEEAETRAQCLRSQLEDMATKSASQDHTISELVAQLASEKQARAEEKEAREKSVALITGKRREAEKSCCQDEHEDLGIVDARRIWRHSADTDISISESDAESAHESVFSRSRSPTLTSSATSTMTIDTTPELLQASLARVVPIPPQQTPRPTLTERSSTFQKMLKTITTPTEEKERDVVEKMFGGVGMGDSGCENCMGKDASVAWDAVGLLRVENKGLKQRVGDLEGAVEEALDLVSGLRL